MKTRTLIFLYLFFLSSCALEKKNDIGILLPDLTKERWLKDEAFFRQRIDELNLSAIFYDAAGNEELQLNQARELMNKGVRVIILGSVNANIAAGIVRDAHKKNIRVIAYDRLIRNCDLDYYVSHNNRQVGELIAAYMVGLKPKGNYVVFLGDRADQNAKFVQEGLLEVLQPHVDSKNIKILYQSFIEGWQGTEAYLELDRFLRYAKETPDVILASGDGIAQGSIKSLSENGLSQKVLVSGQNADLPAIKSLIAGDQTITVYKPLKDLAYTAIDLAADLLINNAPGNISVHLYNGKLEVPSILIPVHIVHKDNIDDILINSGFYTKNEIYGK